MIQQILTQKHANKQKHNFQFKILSQKFESVFFFLNIFSKFHSNYGCWNYTLTSQIKKKCTKKNKESDMIWKLLYLSIRKEQTFFFQKNFF